jgi:small subunit ribosomal protein S21
LSRNCTSIRAGKTKRHQKLRYVNVNAKDRCVFLDREVADYVIIEKAIWRVWRWDFLAEVRVQEGEPLENALRRFKRKVQQEDIIKEVKRHSYYLKPGEKRRVKAALARKRNRKKARKEAD